MSLPHSLVPVSLIPQRRTWTTVHSASSATAFGRVESRDPSLLPPLPLPSLSASLRQLHLALLPLCNRIDAKEVNKELGDLRELVQATEVGSGSASLRAGAGGRDRGAAALLAAQAKLAALRARRPGWFRELWLAGAYLRGQAELVPWSNFAGVFDDAIVSAAVRRDAAKVGGDAAVVTAVHLIAGAVELAQQRAGLLARSDRPPKVHLDMSQEDALFTTTRVALDRCDELRSTPGMPPPHIAVLAKGWVWIVPLVGCADAGSGEWTRRPLSAAALGEALRTVRAEAAALAAGGHDHDERGVAAVTAAPRRDAARHYAALDPVARNEVEAAFWVVSFDEGRPAADPSSVMHQSLIGADAGTRWYDKIGTFVVFDDGSAGGHGEHSYVEAVTTAAVFDHSLARMARGVQLDWTPVAADAPRPRRLFFRPPRDTVEWLRGVRAASAALHDDVEVTVVTMAGVSVRRRAKLAGISPDTLTQLAIQLAYARDDGAKYPTSVYETASTRTFRFGRTETMRSATEEAMDFVQAYPDAPAHVRADLLRRAAAAHDKRRRNASAGHSFDRHLLALRLVAEAEGLTLPAILSSPLLAPLSQFRLSTSQVPVFQRMIGGFAASERDGYGVCYGLNELDTRLCITAYRGAPETNTQRFSSLLQTALVELLDLLGQHLVAVKSKL